MEERPITHAKKLIDTYELAQMLGCGYHQAYTLMRRADFPSFKVGRSWKASITGLDKWIEAQANRSMTL